MTHTNTRLQSSGPDQSVPPHRFRLAAFSLAAGVVLSTLTIGIAAPLSALAARPPASASEPVTIDVIAKVSSFRALPSDGFIATQNLFDKNTGELIGTSAFYCLEVEPAAAGSQTLAECPGTATFSDKGAISILGSFLVPPKPGQSWTVAVVGGTERFRNVRGELKVTQVSAGEEEGIWTLLS